MSISTTMWERKISPFLFYIFMIHKVSFFSCPIKKEQLKLQHERESISRYGYYESVDPSDTYLRVMFTDPRKLLKLVRRYQSISNIWILFHIFHVLYIFHGLVKAIVYSFYVGYDQERKNYLESWYYPTWTANFSEPYLLSNLICIMDFYTIIIRLRCLHKMLVNSIKNADLWHQVDVSHLNFSEAIALQIPLNKLFPLLADTSRHDRDIRKNQNICEAHFKVWDASVHEQLKNFSQKDLIFNIGVLNFKECHSEAVSPQYSTFNLEWAKEYDGWHRAKSRPRNSRRTALFTCFVMILSYPIALFLLLAFFMSVISIELKKYPERDEDGGFWSKLMSYSAHPVHMIKLFEAALSSLASMPNQFDSSMVYFDAHTLRLRIQKLTTAMKLKLESCQDRAHMKNMCATTIRSNFTRRYLKHSKRDRNCFCPEASTLRDLNLEVRDLVKLAKLLYTEFDHIRREHFVYMNLMIFFGAVCSSFCVSLFSVTQSIDEVTIISLLLGLSIVPTINALIFFAGVERAFKDLYIMMTRLLVNERWLLDAETIRIILSGSRCFKRKEDRSIVIFGLYAITPDSVGPFFAFVITAIIFFNKR